MRRKIMAFGKLWKRKLKKLMRYLVFESELPKEKDLIQSLLEILVKFRAIDMYGLVRDTRLSENQLINLLDRVHYKKDDKLVQVFQIRTIRGIKPTIYFSEECGRDL